MTARRVGPSGGATVRAKPAGFCHLHVRSGFSYGIGTATPEELAEGAAGMGHRSLALTDRDALYGVPRFLAASEESGLPAVVGAEISVDVRDAPRATGRAPNAAVTDAPHVVLLCETPEGYRNLSRLITRYRFSSEDRRRPLCPLPVLLEHQRGLVCLTGAIPFGLLARLAADTGRGRASRPRNEVLAPLREAFGPARLYAELTDDRTKGSRRRVARVEAAAKEAGIGTVAAQEVTYLSPRDHKLHEVLAAASGLTRLPGPGHRATDRLHLASPEEMRRLFADRPQALRNAAALAERCAGAVGLSGRLHLPVANLPAGENPAKKLLSLAVAGAKERYRAKEGVTVAEVKARLRREIRCVVELGMVGYFLIAHEAAGIAKEKGVPITGRGSAANSLLAHTLGLTRPDPFEHRLLFERFLHEGRADPPDIDLDLCSRERDGVRDELIRRYEDVGCAVAATANTLSLRGAVRVAARALGHPPAEIDALSRNVPRQVESWEEALSFPQMRGHPLADTARHRLLLGLSWGLRGRLWQAGTHLGGLVFGTPEHRLSDLVPLEPSGKPGLLRVQYDKDDLEWCGIPKLDLLGLRMHTALKEAGELVSGRLGRKVDPLSPPPDDAAAYALIRSGRTAGLFQLESPGQMQLQRRLGARRMRDLCAAVALFRPGPIRGDLTEPYVMRRNAEEPYSVPLPELDEVLRPTYGVLLYQEQVLEIAHRVAGFTLAEADRIRRAMTKDRGPGAMEHIRREFLSRARGVPPEKAREVFSWMESFASYGFSAAHAACFAELSYASAYAMAHYPAEATAGLLNVQPMGFYSPRVLLNEARRRGVGVLPPDIHLSGDGFAVEQDGKALRVGLRYCKGISRAAIDTILSERRKHAFSSPADLYRRTAADAGQVANLIRSGFLDGLGDRDALLARPAHLPKIPKKPRRAAGRDEPPLPHPAGPWEAEARGAPAVVLRLPAGTSPQIREREEREILGLDVRRHPLAAFRGELGALGVTPSEEILGAPHGARVGAAGLLESLQSPPTRSGRPVWFAQIEDESGLLQCTIFRDCHERHGHVLYETGAYLIEGRVEQDRRRGFSFVAEHIRALSEALASTEAGASRAGERSSRRRRSAG